MQQDTFEEASSPGAGTDVPVPNRGGRPRGIDKVIRLADAGHEIPFSDPTHNDIWYGAKCLVSASLPYRNPTKDQLENNCWVRRNGEYTLWVQGGPKGLPFGSYPRIFVIWMTSEAIRTGSPVLDLGASFAEFCRKMSIDPSRGKNGQGRRFLHQCELLLDSRAAFMKGSLDKGRVQRDVISISDGSDLFFAADLPEQVDMFGGSVTLTEKFFKEITEHSIPLDMRAVNALRQSPLELDIYQWLAFRMYSLKKPSNPTWTQLRAQFGSTAGRMVDFRRNFLECLTNVLKVYDAQVRPSESGNGLLLLPSPTPIAPISNHRNAT